MVAKAVSRDSMNRATAGKECFFAHWPLVLLRTCPRKVAVRNHALIEFSRFSLQPGYIPENRSKDAPSELLAICGWVEVIASLAHKG